MTAISHAIAIHRTLSDDLAQWPALIESALQPVPQEFHEEIKNYLRGMYQRMLVARKARASE